MWFDQLKNKYADSITFKKIYSFCLRNKHYLFAVLLIVVLAGSFILLNRPAGNDVAERQFEIKSGSTARDIGSQLLSQGLIRNQAVFDLFAKAEGLDNKLQTGIYALSPSMTTQQIVRILASGKTLSGGITIPEGYTVEQIAQLLADNKIIDDKDEFLKIARDYAPYSYIEKKPGVLYACEGFLFPATYKFEQHSKPEDVLKRLTEEFDRRFDSSMRAEARKNSVSIYDTVILASLVEREAKLKEERSEVASVFINRLRIRMPLQSCASVQYVLPEHKDVLSIADTRINSPYNTYENYGLPVGPIANPGIACLKAALEPAQTDYLFFVVNGKGGHYFARTYAEHEVNMNRQ